MRSQVLESAEPGSYPPERFLCECVCCSPVPAPAWRGLHLPSFPSLQLGQPDMVCLRSPVSCHGDLVRCHLWMWAWWFPTGLDTQAQRIFSAQHSLLEQERKKKRWEKAEKDTGRWKDSSLQRPYPVLIWSVTLIDLQMLNHPWSLEWILLDHNMILFMNFYLACQYSANQRMYIDVYYGRIIFCVVLVSWNLA